MSRDFSGLLVALATPFTSSGEIDRPALARLVRHVVDGGVDFVVTLGTSGEAATVEDKERDEIVSICVKEAGGQKIVVGTGHHATRKTIAWTERAKDLGAAGALVVTPYYNKPTQSGLVAHYAAVAAAVPGFPIIAYNVPGRTAVSINPETMSSIWERVPEVVAVKESAGSLPKLADMVRALPAGRRVLAGDDNLALPSIALGATGLVSVMANVLPKSTAALVRASRSGDLDLARTLHRRLQPLMDALFIESNPIPLKAALSIAGLCEPFVRLPLTPAERTTVERLRAALDVAGGDDPGRRA